MKLSKGGDGCCGQTFWWRATLGLLLLGSIPLFFNGFAAEQEQTARHKYKVTDTAVTPAIQAQGGQMLADYGSYQIWDVPANAKLPAAVEKSASPQRDEAIELNAGEVSTAAGFDRSPAKQQAEFAGRKLHLVQFVGPIKPEWLEALQETGCRVVTYIPRNAYLVYGDKAALHKLQAGLKKALHVQWAGEYLPEHKLHPKARQSAQKALQGAAAEDLFAVQLVEDSESNPETLKFLGEVQRKILRKSHFQHYINVVLQLPPERLAELSVRPDVISIQPYNEPQKRDERQGQILAGNLSGTGPSGPGYLSWLGSKGFTPAQFAASGFVVDVSDSGIDNGTQSPGHLGLYTTGNKALSSRVAYNRLLGFANSGSTLQSCDGHGNLNSHIIAGFNDLSGFPHTDGAGFHYGLGICPFVRVGSSVIFDPESFTNPDYSELQSRAYQDGARISCNSWGASTFGSYNIDCQEYDALVRDAQPAGSAFPSVGNQEMVIVFSAGNSGPSSGSMGSPGSAKNIISVGAAENVHSHSSTNGGVTLSGNDGCSTTDLDADNATEIVDFSSRGPCTDGRMKPDLVGPGTHVTGGVGQEATSGVNGTALACFRATGVCALPGGGTAGSPDNFFPLGQQFYTTSSGTSHSCPAVGGGAALLRQYFINHIWSPPSPAMTKAWLLSSTRYMTGVSANDTLPSGNQGMGSMNLGMAFDGVQRIRRDQKPEDRFSATGQSRVFEGIVIDPTKPFRVTLAWTDAPGSTAANAYNNDLDLVVTVGGQTYRGNVFNGGVSIPGGTADFRNNVESVFLPAGVTGHFTVTVTAANINSDGVPGNADMLDQDFALVIYNSSESAVLLTAAGASLVAGNCAPELGAVDPGETVTMNFALQNLGPSNTTALTATLLPTGGVTTPGAPQNFGVLAGAGATATRPFSFTAAGYCGGQLTATLHLQDGTNDYGNVDFLVPLGSTATNLVTHQNTNAIGVASNDGLGSLYPSTIVVAGAGGHLSTISVSLNGLSHSWPDDLDVLLVGPQGQTTMLMSDVGGDNSVTNLTLVFSSAATNSLPNDGTLTSGLWRPTDFELDGSLPEPAPPGPYGSSFSSLAGIDPNGTWQLYVLDDYPSDDTGILANGWTLTVETTNAACCVNPASADLVISSFASPATLSISNQVTFTTFVTNLGPATATDIIFTDTLSSSVAFISVDASGAACTFSNGVVACNLGNRAPGQGTKITILAQVTAGPLATSTAAVSASQSDPNLFDNQAVASASVIVPSLTIQDTSVVEGDSGTTVAIFLVALSQSTSFPVDVDWRTVSGTALAGLDFAPQTNHLHFLPGELAKTIAVAVYGDLLNETDESFQVVLTNVVNASLGRAAATATIVDNDPVPVLSIGNTAVVEGNSGATSAVFVVSLSAPSGQPVSAYFATSNGTAQAGSDYNSVFGEMISLAPGQLSTNILIQVTGDTNVERDETFFVRLFSPTNAVLGNGIGTGTILTDDRAPILKVAGFRITSESKSPPNDAMDPGETVTLSVALLNTGSSNTTNLVATLLATGGVQSPSGAQTYGVLSAGGPQVSRPFTFVVGPSNCSTLTLSFSLQDGAANLGTISISQTVGNCFADDFEPNIDLALWSAFGGTLGTTVLATNYGGSVSGSNSLWFGDDASRFATTVPVNALEGGSVYFYLRFGSGVNAPWEFADLPEEGVVLEYSTNGGLLWTEMGRFTTTNYYSWTRTGVTIPVEAQTSATQFRWRQLLHSGSCCDHWALDDVLIVTGPQPPSIFTQPASRTVVVGDVVTLSVSASGSSPLFYQWQKNGTAISGANTASLTFNNAQTNDSGAYSVMVTNKYGSVTSAVASLTVVPGISVAEAVDAPYLTFTRGGNSNWFGQILVTSDGVDAAQSGRILDSQQSWMETTVVGPGQLSFWWQVSSESCCDYLAFSINGLTQASISGSTSWAARSFTLTNGAQTLRWMYSKDGSVSSGADAGWVDRLVFSGSATNPVIISQTSNQVAVVGGTASFGVVAGGAPPLTYAWRKNGVPIPGANASVYTATNILLTDSGALFSCLVTNIYGSTISSNALLTVVPQSLAVAVFDDPTVVDSGNGSGAESDTIQASLQSLGFAVLTFTNVQTALSTYEMLLIPEQEISDLASRLTNGLRAALSNYVASGHLLVVIGGELHAQSLVNQVFGFSVLESSSVSGGTYLRTAFAAGTQFTNSPPSIPANDATTTLNVASLPPGSRSIYETNGQSAVAMLPVGAGQVIFLGWDWYNAAPLGATNGGWLSVLSSAVQQRSPAGPSAPFIYGQPTSLTAFVGSTATFNIVATGTQPLTYVWRRDGLTIPGANGPSYSLVNVQLTNSGTQFSCLVTNAYGTALSATAVLTVVTSSPNPTVVYLRSSSGGVPWGRLDNESILNVVFRTNWQDFRFETANPVSVFSQANTFIYMDGSDAGAMELNTFLQANLPAITNWVANGGSLFLNAAPNEGSSINFGFGVTLTYPDTGQTSGALNFTHPVFQGPYLPVGTSFTGSDFSHATVSGVGLQGVLTNQAGRLALGEKAYGAGHILFGGMTLPSFHLPLAQASNLLANILFYGAGLPTTGTSAPPVISSQPASQTVNSGGTATFNVTATGAAPLVYSWRKNGVLIPGANAAAYAVTNAQLSDSGSQFRCFVTNAFGAALSSNATLTVTPVGQAVAVFDDPLIVDSSGGPNAESDTVQASLQSLGFSVSTFTNFESAVQTYELLLIPEQESGDLASSLTTSAKAALVNFVASGHTVVMHGPGDRGQTFLNNVFGIPVVLTAQSSFGPTYLRTTNAIGTPFTNAPILLPHNNGSSTIVTSSLPPGARSIYETNGQSVVAILYVGGGRIIFMGWDWFGAFPLGGIDGGWLSALNSAASDRSSGGFSVPYIVTQPTNQALSVGATAYFGVTAYGAGPVTYAWRKNGSNIPGATNALLVLSGVTSNNIGAYSAIVANPYGAVTSSVAQLTVASSVFVSFRNPSPILITNSQLALPYPSIISVTGLSRTVTGVSVTLSNLIHSRPSDLDILLESPTGQKLMLMSDAGGAFGVTNLFLTFIDSATALLPFNALMTNGNYRPTDYEPGETMPPPAPAGPYATNFSVFRGIIPNGFWKLYISDDSPLSDAGFLVSGWGMQLELGGPPPLAIARSGSSVTLAWPVGAAAVLQESLTLDPPAWTTLSPQPPSTVVGGATTVVLSAPGATRYYRLLIQ